MDIKDRVMDGLLDLVCCARRLLPCFLLLLIPKEICGCPSVCQLCTGKQATCRSVGLTNVPNTFPISTKLLYLSGNNISAVNLNEFRNLQQLAILYMDNVGLCDVHPKAFCTLKRLYYLHLNNNHIKYLNPGSFDGLYNLNYLYMQYNQIAVLPRKLFCNLVAVRYLSLQGNHLTALGRRTFFGMTSLHTLNLANNKISKISNSAFYRLLKLEQLHLECNNLTLIPSNTFKSLKILKRLFLSNNAIESIHPMAFKGLDGLQYLFLEKAKIKQISNNAFVGLNNLNHLVLSNNELDIISSKMFRFLHQLRYLQLDRNKIVSIEESVFENVGAFLKVLNLAHNNLTGLEPRVLQPLVSLSLLQASYNPWGCDCSLLGLYRWLRSSSITVNIYCQNPPNLCGRPLRNIKRAEFEDCSSAASEPSGEFESTSVNATTVMAWFDIQMYKSSSHQPTKGHVMPNIPITLQTPKSLGNHQLYDNYNGIQSMETITATPVQIPAPVAPANFTGAAKNTFSPEYAPVSLKSGQVCQEQFDKLNQAFDILLGIVVVACVVIMGLSIKIVQYRQKLKKLENSGDNILEYYSCYHSARYNVSSPVQLTPQNLVRNRCSDQIRLIKPTLPESQAQVILFEHSVL
ncbi:leucine-rich repeat-containing protein 70 [Lissotriton helveticus]